MQIFYDTETLDHIKWACCIELSLIGLTSSSCRCTPITDNVTWSSLDFVPYLSEDSTNSKGRDWVPRLVYNYTL